MPMVQVDCHVNAIGSVIVHLAHKDGDEKSLESAELSAIACRHLGFCVEIHSTRFITFCACDASHADNKQRWVKGRHLSVWEREAMLNIIHLFHKGKCQ